MNESEKDAIIQPTKISEKGFHRFFVISLAIKGIDAFLQTVFGFILLFTSGISDLILSLIHKELLEDPNDFFANHIAGAASHLSPGLQYFGALYLLTHGILKAFLIWALLKNKIWAYPAALIIFSLFIVYQLVHFSGGNWFILGPFTAFELLLLYLIYHEYRYLRGRRKGE